MKSRCGFSLIELMAVLVLLGMISAASSIAFRSPSKEPVSWRSVLIGARRQAMRTGVPVSGFSDSIGAFTAFPEGLIVTDSAPRLRFTLEGHAR